MATLPGPTIQEASRDVMGFSCDDFKVCMGVVGGMCRVEGLGLGLRGNKSGEHKEETGIL